MDDSVLAGSPAQRQQRDEEYGEPARADDAQPVFLHDGSVAERIAHRHETVERDRHVVGHAREEDDRDEVSGGGGARHC